MKRIFDIFGAITGLVLLFPLLVVLGFILRREMGTPILFRQIRSGLHGQAFQIIKFRTMRDALGPYGQELPDLERLTPLGQKLRSSSADELPGLWNVLKGDMSLVGPRPLLMEYSPLYTPEQARRNEVRPGITGWAQVNGRNAISWDEKFALDVWYVDNRTFWLDLKILVLTILKVLARDGITAADGGMMPKFRGTSKNTRNDEKQQE